MLRPVPGAAVVPGSGQDLRRLAVVAEVPLAVWPRWVAGAVVRPCRVWMGEAGSVPLPGVLLLCQDSPMRSRIQVWEQKLPRVWTVRFRVFRQGCRR